VKPETLKMESGIVHKHFPLLSELQITQFDLLGPLYHEWNAKVNVISRKDIENLYERHILHSLAIARHITFAPGSRIMDAGTGGGFPGIPLAIMFPEAHFHLIDSTAKKLMVVKEIAEATGLANVSVEHSRLEDHRGRYDFIVSRAVTGLPQFCHLVSGFISAEKRNPIPNGILYLKGGDINSELELLNRNFKVTELSGYFEEDFFTTKKLIHIW
jgi:16S rRNA (guanine527-N7)-methyltransferase